MARKRARTNNGQFLPQPVKASPEKKTAASDSNATLHDGVCIRGKTWNELKRHVMGDDYKSHIDATLRI